MAARARIPIETLLKYYRRHNIPDDAFEANGQFCQVQLQVVMAKARSDGFLSTEAEVQLLLKRCALSLETALAMPRGQLYAVLAPVFAVDARLVGAAATLLRSANVRTHVHTQMGAVSDVSEDDELEPSMLRAFLTEANHRRSEDHQELCLELEAEELDSIEQQPTIQDNSGSSSLPNTSVGAVSSNGSLVLDEGSVASRHSMALPTVGSHVVSAPEPILLSPRLSNELRRSATTDTKLALVFKEAERRGLQLALPPQAEALTVGSAAAHLLPRTIAYGWQKPHGWLLGQIIAVNDNAEARHAGVPINFVVSYTAHDGEVEEAEHALCVEDYGKPAVNGWLLFESRQGEQMAELPARTLASTRAPRQELVRSSVPREQRASTAATNAKIAASAIMDSSRALLPSQLLMLGRRAGGPSLDLTPVQPATSGRSLPLFARSSLARESLPPVPLLLCSNEVAAKAVEARLEEQAILSGHGLDALRQKERTVQKMDLYFQAASGGHAGLFGSHVGGQLWTLQAKPSYMALLFLDMTRVHGVGRESQLAFRRGGLQAVTRSRMTRADVTELLEALQLSVHGTADQRKAAAAAVGELRGQDVRILAGETVVNAVFARLVREMHAPGGVFAIGLTEGLLESGAPKLCVGALLVKQLARFFTCSTRPRQRLLEGGGGSDYVGGLINEGPRARDRVTGEVSPYAASTLQTYKSALSWHLRREGWQTVKVQGTPTRPAYLSVVELEMRVVRKAYFNSVCLATKQKLYRAMAATEDVMQLLLSLTNVAVALDLMTVVAMLLSYALGLRVSDVSLLTWSNFRFGRSQQRADVEFTTPRHKGDGKGHGFSRQLQHCEGCGRRRRVRTSDP